MYKSRIIWKLRKYAPPAQMHNCTHNHTYTHIFLKIYASNWKHIQFASEQKERKKKIRNRNIRPIHDEARCSRPAQPAIFVADAEQITNKHTLKKKEENINNFSVFKSQIHFVKKKRSKMRQNKSVIHSLLSLGTNRIISNLNGSIK